MVKKFEEIGLQCRTHQGHYYPARGYVNSLGVTVLDVGDGHKLVITLEELGKLHDLAVEKWERTRAKKGS